MEQSLSNRFHRQASRYTCLQSACNQTVSVLATAREQMREILKEQDLLERTNVALQQARPLLSVSSIKQAESLCNSALSAIFGIEATVEWDPESSCFTLNHGDYQTTLVDAEGGGISTVLSVCLECYLLVKLNKRRLMVYDEAFYAVSEKYMPAFLMFIRQLCHDLSIDLLLVSHDARITLDDVDSAYLIEDGYSKKLK